MAPILSVLSCFTWKTVELRNAVCSKSYFKTRKNQVWLFRWISASPALCITFIVYIAWTIFLVTVYVEIFAGILFREIVKTQAPRNFRGFNFRDYVACLVLRPTYVQFLRVLFSRMQTNSRNTRKLIHRENFNVYGTWGVKWWSHSCILQCLCSKLMYILIDVYIHTLRDLSAVYMYTSLY